MQTHLPQLTNKSHQLTLISSKKVIILVNYLHSLLILKDIQWHMILKHKEEVHYQILLLIMRMEVWKYTSLNNFQDLKHITLILLLQIMQDKKLQLTSVLSFKDVLTGVLLAQVLPQMSVQVVVILTSWI